VDSAVRPSATVRSLANATTTAQSSAKVRNGLLLPANMMDSNLQVWLNHPARVQEAYRLGKNGGSSRSARLPGTDACDRRASGAMGSLLLSTAYGWPRLPGARLPERSVLDRTAVGPVERALPYPTAAAVSGFQVNGYAPRRGAEGINSRQSRRLSPTLPTSSLGARTLSPWTVDFSGQTGESSHHAAFRDSFNLDTE
jgi:hypothetical protein